MSLPECFLAGGRRGGAALALRDKNRGTMDVRGGATRDEGPLLSRLRVVTRTVNNLLRKGSSFSRDRLHDLTRVERVAHVRGAGSKRW